MRVFGWDAKQAKKEEAVEALCLAVASHLFIHNVSNIAAFVEKLHNLLAGFAPTAPGFRIRVLLQPSNLISVDNEVHLSRIWTGLPFTKVGHPGVDSGVIHPAALSRGRWAGVPNEEAV